MYISAICHGATRDVFNSASRAFNNASPIINPTSLNRWQGFGWRGLGSKSPWQSNLGGHLKRSPQKSARLCVKRSRFVCHRVPLSHPVIFFLLFLCLFITSLYRDYLGKLCFYLSSSFFFFLFLSFSPLPRVSRREKNLRNEWCSEVLETMMSNWSRNAWMQRGHVR